MNRNKRLYAIAFGALGMILLVSTVTALSVGNVTHRYTGADECLVLDPEDGAILIKENVEPNDTYTIRQFITNSCDNAITVELTLDAPQVSYISVDSGSGLYDIPPGSGISETATVTFGNHTPANFSAKDVVFKVGRPE